MRVRLIEYTSSDPNLPHAGAIQRWLTTRLEPQCYPMLELAGAYHGRGELATGDC